MMQMAYSEKFKILLSEKGIFLLPNLCTLASLFFGFYAIVMATASQYEDAAVAIILALVMDGLDGRVARLTNTQTNFGADLDSLSDMVSFGLAPAMTWYLWLLSDYSKLGIGLAFFYAACVALRLARFNNDETQDKAYFKGLPCPAAAVLLAAIVWVAPSIPSEYWDLIQTGLPSVLVFLALAMVSPFPYYSFKSIGDRGRVSFMVLVAVVAMMALFAWAPQWVVLSFFSAYALHGLVLACLGFPKEKEAEHDSLV